MCYRVRANAVPLTLGEARLGDSVGVLSCVSCVCTKSYRVVIVAQRSTHSIYDVNLVKGSMIDFPVSPVLLDSETATPLLHPLRILTVRGGKDFFLKKQKPVSKPGPVW